MSRLPSLVSSVDEPAAMVPYETPAPPAPFRRAFGDEMGRGFARGAIRVGTGLAVVGVLFLVGRWAWRAAGRWWDARSEKKRAEKAGHGIEVREITSGAERVGAAVPPPAAAQRVKRPRRRAAA